MHRDILLKLFCTNTAIQNIVLNAFLCLHFSILIFFLTKAILSSYILYALLCTIGSFVLCFASFFISSKSISELLSGNETKARWYNVFNLIVYRLSFVLLMVSCGFTIMHFI